jgi:membrane protease YdiL (CAAX protease family)
MKDKLLTKLLYFFVFFLTVSIALKVIFTGIDGVNSLLMVSIRNISFSVILILLFSKQVGGLKSALFRGKIVFLPVILIVFILVNSYKQSMVYNLSFAEYVMYIFKTFSVAFWEELLFRYYLFTIIFYHLSRKMNAYAVVLLTSLIFALIHFLNLFNPNIFKLSIIIQVFFAFGIGVLLQSIFLRTKNLMTAMVIHFAVNIFGTYSRYYEHTSEMKINAVESYTYTEFFESFISVAILVSIIMIPLSMIIMPRQIEFDKNTNNHEL